MAHPGRQFVRFLRELIREPVLALWALYICLLPFRVFPSGYPQPVDGLGVILFFVVAARWSGRMAAPLLSPLRLLIGFTVWVTLVDIAWCAIEWDWGYNAVIPLYYVFNATIFFAVLALFQKYGDRFLRVTLYALFAITLFQVAASFLIQFNKARTSLFFNNSNQLGYYSLLAACLIAIMQRQLRFGLVKSSLMLTACAYLSLLSASRSALIGIGILLLLLVLTDPRVIAIAFIAGLGLGLASSNDGTVSQTIEQSQRRLTEDRNPNSSFFEERGYDRIWNNKEYLVTGAGEGHTERFAEEGTTLPGLEIHSAAGTILFSYGFIGVFVVVAMLVKIVRGSRRRLAMMLLPVMLHSLAHQGLRFPLLWITLAMFLAVKVAGANRRAARAPTTTRHTSAALITSPSRI